MEKEEISMIFVFPIIGSNSGVSMKTLQYIAGFGAGRDDKSGNYYHYQTQQPTASVQSLSNQKWCMGRMKLFGFVCYSISLAHGKITQSKFIFLFSKKHIIQNKKTCTLPIN